jgi:PAS domain S-box-containing protein
MATSENLRGLVVEDTPEMAAQLKRILEKKFGLSIEVAPDCATARDKLKAEAFDIATLDFMLPDGRGLELLEEITARGDLPRVIMVTGHGDEESAVRSFRSQASGYVIKDSQLGSRLAESVEKALVEIDLRRAQAELSRREAHFRSLTEKSSDIVTVMRADGTILYESPSVERYLGYKPDEMLGKNAYDYVHPEDLPRLSRLFQSTLEKPGALLLIEYRFRHKEGPWRYFESIGRNLLTDPVVGGVVVNSRDVTRRKLAELELERHREQLEGLVQERTAELAEANEKLREEIAERKQAQAELQERAERLADFLTVASHELRHPISVVKGYTTMLQGYLDRMEPEVLPEISDALNISVNRLTGYVDELMESSLVEQGRYTFDIVDTDLRPLLDESIRDLKGLGVDKDVGLKVGEGAGRALVDPRKFKRLIDMLLDNAIKFAEDGEPVDIDVGKDGKVTTVAVMDRGIGVPEESREQIFERFYQVEEVQHHSSVGLGLGLYLARQIVTAHNGEIGYEPRDGGGSIFKFTMACG